MTDVRTFTRNQTIISMIISMALSAAFYILVFGGTDPVTIMAPDNFALDFLPQSVLASFMAALMPALQARSAMTKGKLPGSPPAAGVVFRRAVIFALLALGLAGIAIGLLAISDIASLSRNAAFAVKVAYGALLGLVFTPPALRAVLSKG